MATETYAGEMLGSRETQPRQLIVTIFGLYARAERNWLSVASVVKLMADLGVDGPAVRSSISRLKRRGLLHSERHAGAAGYSLSESTLDLLAEGDIRIFERSRSEVGDGWILVVFSIPEVERDKRHALRTTLTRLGFGTVSPGVWIAPGNLMREVRHTLERRNLVSYVDVFRGDHLAFGDLRAKVRTWWNFEELNTLYADFLVRYRPALHRVTAGKLTPCQAFTKYVPLLTEWRRLPYRDPGLPLSLLPPGWKGETAGELFDKLNRALSGPAREHATEVMHG
ncbi:PaaX family transcriptional regulator [Amycolatopsis taiwanensis]|nr:PaaX family transcriptional regulator C-terminal domain-containing protein [Amycolatopsis taiwanensis]